MSLSCLDVEIVRREYLTLYCKWGEPPIMFYFHVCSDMLAVALTLARRGARPPYIGKCNDTTFLSSRLFTSYPRGASKASCERMRIRLLSHDFCSGVVVVVFAARIQF